MNHGKTLESLQPIAQQAVREALRGRPLTEDMKKDLALGQRVEGDYAVYDLYIPGERPLDARSIALARVHIVTKEVTVEVFV